MRGAVADAARHADAPTRLRLLPSLLADPTRAVRSAAAFALADIPADRLPANFERALNEYVDEQRFNADRPEAQLNLATVMAARGQSADAEAALREAIALERAFAPAFLNLADLYRSRGDEAKAEQTLRDGLAASPRAAALHHALGLSLIRQRRRADAIAELSAASRLDPGHPRYAFVEAVALHDVGRLDDAIAVLTRASSSPHADRDILMTLATYLIDRGQAAKARPYVERLFELDPNNAGARMLRTRVR